MELLHGPRGGTAGAVVVLLVIVLLGPLSIVCAQSSEATAANPAQLRAALEAGSTRVALLSHMTFTPENWPDPPLLVTRSVTLYSPYRVKLDFCGSAGAPARPLFNVTATGSLLLQRVFLRNFLPSVPQDLSGMGPVPALLSSGGRISFSVVVFHILPSVAWAFNAPPETSFWSRERSTPGFMNNVYSGAPLQLDTPALYLLKLSSPQYSIATCYSPVDIGGCYADNREDTTLVYCLYTFADALRNPHVRYARVFHDVGFDRIAYNTLNPIELTKPKTYSACPGSHPSLNMDAAYAGVTVRAPLELVGLRFRGSLSTNFTTWPRALPLLLGLFDVDGSGMVTLINSTVEVPDLPATARMLRGLPGKDVADVSRPNLQPTVVSWPSPGELSAAQTVIRTPNVIDGGGIILGAWSNHSFAVTAPSGVPDTTVAVPPGAPLPSFIIRSWVLAKNAWQQYASLNAYESLSTPSDSVWRYEGVQVQQSDLGNVQSMCFGAALEQGAMWRSHVAVVANDLQLRAALVRAARYIQMVADIRLDPANWPTGREALLVEAGIVEVRGCHPVPGKRYTIDLANMLGVVRSLGRLVIQGDLRFINPGWRTLPPADVLAVSSGALDVSPLGAFRVAPNRAGGSGSLELEGVLVEDPLESASTGLRPADMLVILHLAASHLTPAIRSRNASLLGSSGVTLGMWSITHDATQSGTWVFINTDILWAAVVAGTVTATSEEGDGGGGGRGTDVKVIAIPVAVCGTLVLALALLGVAYVRFKKGCFLRRGTAEALAAEKALAAAEEGESTKDGGNHGGNYRKEGSEDTPLAKTMSTASTDMITANGRVSTSGAGTATARQQKGLVSGARESPESGYSASGAGTDLSNMAGGGGFTPRTGAMSQEALCGSGGRGPLGDIDAAKRAIAAGRPSATPSFGHTSLDDIELLSVLGEGSYGRVYRALWRGTTVAVKVILLPAHMSGRERHERMAVMEAAISSSLSHPNVVQTYTYTVGEVQGAKARGAAMRMAEAGSNASVMPGSGAGAMVVAAGGSAAGSRSEVGSSCKGAGGETAATASDLVGYEIRLVQEFCDHGSLRDKLNARVFFRPAAATRTKGQLESTLSRPSPLPTHAAIGALPPMSLATSNLPAAVGLNSGGGGTGPPAASSAAMDAAAGTQSGSHATTRGVTGSGAGCDAVGAAAAGCPPPALVVDLAAVLDTAIDVARAVAHLHREGIVHADLKPRNVLLKGSTHDPRGFVAKVADFGLSTRLDADETHVSNAYHGTLAYMAPETLLNGHVSRASDVYGFGIMLYELYTGDTAYRSVPKALLGHAITKDNLRPIFPPGLEPPFEYQLLACRCWESNPEIRPEFEFIVDELKRMRMRLCAPAADTNVSSSHAVAGPSASGAIFLRQSTMGGEQWGMPQLQGDVNTNDAFVANPGGGLLRHSASRSVHSQSVDHACESEDEEGSAIMSDVMSNAVMHNHITPTSSWRALHGQSPTQA